MYGLLRLPCLSLLNNLTGLVLLFMVTLCSHAVAAPLCKQAPLIPTERLRLIWQENSRDLWFYDATGQRVIPDIDEDWVAVRFNCINASMGMPENVRAFGQRFANALDDVIYNPSQPDLALYHFKPTQRNGVMTTILDGAEPTLRYVLPAFIYREKRVVLGEQITIRWKSQLVPEQRRQLLHSIGAINYPVDLSGRLEVVRIDPSRMAVWKAANLLTEDVQVVTALPELLPVEVPVSVSFQLASPGTVVGAALPFSLDIYFNDRVKIEPETLANLNLKPPEIFRNLFAIEYDTPLSVVDVRHSPIQIRGRLYLYTSGQFELPAIPVFYRDTGSDGEQLHHTTSPSITVRLAALIPEGKGDYRLHVPSALTMNDVDLQATPVSRSVVWRMLIAGIILVSGGIVLLSRRRFQQQQRVVQIVQTTPLQALYQAVADARQDRDLLTIAEVGLMVRRYLIDWSDGADVALGGGSERFCRRLRQRVPVVRWHEEIQPLLQQLEDHLSQGGDCVTVEPLLDRIERLAITLEKQRPVVAADGDAK